MIAATRMQFNTERLGRLCHLALRDRASEGWKVARSRGALVLDRLFPDRQIYVRSRGRIQFVALSQRAQSAVAGLAVLAVVGFALTAFLLIHAETAIATGAQSARLAAERLGARIAEERDLANRQSDLLSGRVELLQAQLDGFKDHQLDLVDWLYREAADDVERVERTLAMTGLDVDQLTRAVSSAPSGRGGPLVALDWPAAAVDDLDLVGDPFRAGLARLESTLARWSDLRMLLRQLPLGRPTDRGWVSSQYGKRRDPFSRRLAHHAGIDISAPPRTPIYTTAPGEVVFVGTKGPYGRMVVVDHGVGFKTRYGHLSKIFVRPGQKVEYHHKIGLMGSTGRSSGRHLHYEIVYRDKHLNPAKFIDAGKYAFKEIPN